ncbi:MAG: hypothetical protein K0Q50_878 [Vampirovibrio sp.]|jgi:hypothetical protein|nr:hypothetical protein [Vampirovibrio sp.]
MITSSSSMPLFAGRKRQHAELGVKDAQRRSPGPATADSITVETDSDDSFTPSSTRSLSPSHQLLGEQRIAEAEGKTARTPNVGDVFQSRSAGNLRRQAKLLSEKELLLDLERHSAFKTHHALDLILDVEHPLHPDKKYTKKSEKLNSLANDRYKALFDLHSLVQNPSYRISPHSKKYLKAVGIINRDNVIDQATLYDVKRILHLDPDTQEFSLIRPSQSEANTYFRLSGKS